MGGGLAAECWEGNRHDAGGEQVGLSEAEPQGEESVV